MASERLAHRFWEDGTGTAKVRVTLKGGGEKHIELGPDLVERLKDALLAREDVLTASQDKVGELPLLVNSVGQKWNRKSLSEMIFRLGRRAKVTRPAKGVRPHMLRHTYNVVGDQVAGLSVTVRAALLNHAGTATLQRYDHLMAKDTAAARDAVRAAMKAYAGQANQRDELSNGRVRAALNAAEPRPRARQSAAGDGEPRVPGRPAAAPALSWPVRKWR